MTMRRGTTARHDMQPDAAGTTGRRGDAAASASESGNPLVDMQTMTPTSRLDDPGIGLRDNGRRVLTYADLQERLRRSGRPRAGPHDRAASDRPHGAVRVVVRRHQVLGRRAAAPDVRRTSAHRARQRHDDDAPDSPARHVERPRGRRGRLPRAQAHRRHAARDEAQLPRHAPTRSAGGRITATCCFTWKRACSGKCGWKNEGLAAIAAGLGDRGRCSAQVPGAPRQGLKAHEGHGAPPQKPPAHAAPRRPGSRRRPGLPPITDDDRAAAFPDVEGQHTVHDDAVHYYVLFDQLEWQAGTARTACRGTARAGSDATSAASGSEPRARRRRGGRRRRGARVVRPRDRPVVGRGRRRASGLPAGLRRTWAAVGVQGLAPYWFEVEATAYVGASGRTQFRVETEYELLLTNRLVLQPLVEIDVFGRSDRERGVGAGLSTIDAGPAPALRDPARIRPVRGRHLGAEVLRDGRPCEGRGARGQRRPARARAAGLVLRNTHTRSAP